VLVWILIPAYAGSVGTDIVQGTCVPWGVYSGHASEIAVSASVVLITYIGPLTLMLFCYIRIVYALKHEVNCLAMTVRHSVLH